MLMHPKKFAEKKREQKAQIALAVSKLICGQEVAEKVFAQNINLLEETKDKNYKLVGFITEDSEKLAVNLKRYSFTDRNGKKYFPIPVFLSKKYHHNFEYFYKWYSSTLEDVAKTAYEFIASKSALVIGQEWSLVVLINDKDEAVKFLTENKDYSDIATRIKRDFEIRDAIRSKDKEFFKKEFILQKIE